MENLKHYVAALLIIALAVVIGLHLALFWVNDGRLIIGEPSKILRTIEAVLAGCIFLFGIERFVDAIKLKSSKTEGQE
jgi:hypothetical protein